jgi:hypothetical protein
MFGGAGFRVGVRRISVGRSSSQQVLVPHLRCWASGDAVDPALPGWATVFRASGAAFRITNDQSAITNSRRRVSHHESPVTCHESRATRRSAVSLANSRIPSRPSQRADPQSAVSMRRSRTDRAKARAPEARQMVAQPGRAGYGSQRKFEHRRCGTYLTLRRLRHGGTVWGTSPLGILLSARAEASDETLRITNKNLRDASPAATGSE